MCHIFTSDLFCPLFPSRDTIVVIKVNTQMWLQGDRWWNAHTSTYTVCTWMQNLRYFSISTLWSRMNLTVKCLQFVVSDPTWVQLPPQVPRPADTTDDEKPPPLPQPRKKAPKTARVWHQVSAGAETTPSTHLCRVFTGSPHSLHFFLQVHVSYGASLLMFYWGRRLHD